MAITLLVDILGTDILELWRVLRILKYAFADLLKDIKKVFEAAKKL